MILREAGPAAFLTTSNWSPTVCGVGNGVGVGVALGVRVAVGVPAAGGPSITPPPSRNSYELTPTKAGMGGNGLWNVVPPSRLKEFVTVLVASSKEMRRTICPVTSSGSIDTVSYASVL